MSIDSEKPLEKNVKTQEIRMFFVRVGSGGLT